MYNSFGNISHHINNADLRHTVIQDASNIYRLINSGQWKSFEIPSYEHLI